MVGWLVHQQHVVPLEHKLSENHAALLSTGQHFHGFRHVVAREQQSPQNAAYLLVVVSLAPPVCHPVGQDVILVEVVCVVLREVSDVGLVCPLDGSMIHLKVASQAAQQGGLSDTVWANDGNTLSRLDTKVQV